MTDLAQARDGAGRLARALMASVERYTGAPAKADVVQAVKAIIQGIT